MNNPSCHSQYNESRKEEEILHILEDFNKQFEEFINEINTSTSQVRNDVSKETKQKIYGCQECSESINSMHDFCEKCQWEMYIDEQVEAIQEAEEIELKEEIEYWNNCSDTKSMINNPYINEILSDNEIKALEYYSELNEENGYTY
ncbi:hypothetical protein [Aquisalibacillus elongatus]|uniref:Uncharacterized protein n=1 Tax=Aquisalibacillus elongatus TaxID=485577 RepID=A0A3N5B9K1_9BACI|nr:hypothetical protein [Aquisalibacillus elongatus]RPF54416.1 hypothetical protein EDC24_1615 [Aquisalibacillus elongatus]